MLGGARSLLLVVLGSLVWLPSAVHAQEAQPGRIEGKVVTTAGEPVEGAVVILVALRRRVTTGADGTFVFDAVPPGTYAIEAVSPLAGSGVATADVAAGESARPVLSLDVGVHHEDVVVSASADPEGISDVGQPVTVLDSTELQSKGRPTIGETLSAEPGVTASAYAPGTSRPVIRGLGGDRIRILSDGLGVGDASNVSEDHAVGMEAMSAERIEIVRGPATLMYGSNAVGGVVNVLSGKIPDHRPDRPLTGTAEVRYSTVAEGLAGAVALDGRAASLAWHASGVREETDDTETPAGPLVNSDLDTKSAAAGAAWIGDKGRIGLSFERFDTNYGIPNPDEPIRIDLTQDRWSGTAEWNAPIGVLRAVRLRVGRSDYEHAEIEDTGEIGTRFLADGWEMRLEAPHRDVGPVRGSVGAQAGARDLDAIGEEAYVPPTTTRSRALFAFEEIGRGPVTLELGARFEDQDTSAEAAVPARSFSGLSGSGGAVWRWAGDWSLGAVLSRTTRFPTAEELYANGPHLATFQFQVGAPDLREERGLGLDVSLRRKASDGRISGELSLFEDRFDRFVFLRPTGALVDVDGELLPEFRYVQADATFRGAELHADFELLHSDPHHLQVEVRADVVRAEERDSGLPLPRIPPIRAGLGLAYRGERFWGRVDAMRVSEQDRVAPAETPTEGYTLVEASAGVRFVRGRLVHDLLVRGTNLTDELARNHVSALKDLVPLAGRDLGVSYRITF